MKYREVEITEQGGKQIRKYRRIELPHIVCLCGSTKFKDHFIEANKVETMLGHLVLTVGVFGHADNEPLSDEQKVELDKLHLKKIDLADEVLILNVGGYMGDGTMSEIAYAVWRRKTLRFLEPPVGGIDSWLFNNRLTLGKLVAKHSGLLPPANAEKTITLDNDIEGLGKAGEQIPMSRVMDWSATKGFELGYHRRDSTEEEECT